MLKHIIKFKPLNTAFLMPLLTIKHLPEKEGLCLMKGQEGVSYPITWKQALKRFRRY